MGEVGEVDEVNEVDRIDSLIDVTMDMTAALTAQERYRRLLAALRRFIPYDAAALFRVHPDGLEIAASSGLTDDAGGRCFHRKDHPRLDIICNGTEPVVFPADTRLPDPFDGLLSGAPHDAGRIHSCLGCALRVNGELIGALTADALDPSAFDGLDRRFIKALASLAAAELHTTALIRALEQSAEKMGRIAHDLMREGHEAHKAEMIGTDPRMQHLRREIELVAPSDFSVLVTGETGVGKELVVRGIHAASRRSGHPMLYLNCAAFPENLAESELFGHVRGAFTGAVGDRAGKFELADEGTLFLDEIGELPLSVQPKLLRVLQQGEIQRVGSDRTQVVNVRLLAATNRDLAVEVEAGRFRADLFHRLNVYPLRVPSLRERPGDIELLAGHFCERLQRRLGTGAVRLAPETRRLLARYTWPGNVRELENAVSRAVLKASFQAGRGGVLLLEPEHFGADLDGSDAPSVPPTPAASRVAASGMSLKAAVDRFKRETIEQAVAAHNGNWAAAGRKLGIHRSNLFKLAERLGIRKDRL